MTYEISKEQFGDWKRHPVTEAFFAAIREQIKSLYDGMVAGCTLNLESSDSTQANTAILIGHLRGLEYVLNAEIYDQPDSPDEPKT